MELLLKRARLIWDRYVRWGHVFDESVCILPLALPPAAPLQGVPIAKGGAESSVSPDRADSEQTQTI